MKSISKFISLALLIAAATACNTKEIDKPDIPDQPQISGNVKFTASMKQTRVEYSVNGDKLHQCWEVDDVIYGFYGDNPVGKVTLKVTEVDEDTEYATLEATVAEEGADFIAAIKNAGEEHIPVGLLYTGSNDNAVNNKTVTVDMHNQSRGNIPACMTSTLYEITKDSESGDTLIQFDFDNECAILEIQSLTGIAETAGLPEGQTIDLASIEVAGVLPYCKYTYDDGSFSSEQSNEYYNSVIVKPTTERPLKANSNGNIVDADGNISCIRIAVSATSPFSITSTEITVTATSDDDDDDPEVYRSKYKGVLHPGCYIICAQDVVAKTEDGFYFTTVKAAFDHAEYLNTNSLLGDKPNIVTLLKSEIDGLGEQTASPAHNEQIEIDYNVTLDLNGCTLSLDGSEGFNVNNTPATFTITDSNGLNDNEEYEGNIESTSSNPIIINNGNVKIDGGEFYYTFSDGNSYEHCCMIDNEGSLTIGNDSYLQVDGTTPNNNVMYFLISSTGTLTVNSGSLNSYDVLNTIGNLGGTVTIHGGKVYSESRVALYSDSGSTTTIDGKDALIKSDDASQYQAIVITSGDTTKTSFTMSAGKVEGAFSAVLIDGKVSANISGGYIKSNVYHTLCVFNNTDSKELNPSCIITGGVIHNTSTQSGANSAVYCFTQAKRDDGNKDLVVKWAKGNEGDGQPILFSKNMYPLCAEYYQLNNNFAQIEVSGGYLYSTKTESSRCFYDERDESGDDGYYCLTIPENSSIYTNTNCLFYGTKRKAFSLYPQGGGNTASLLTTAKEIDKFQELIGSLSFTYCISTP